MEVWRHITSILIIALWPVAAVAQVETTFFLEDFDGVVAPVLPEGWVAEGDEWGTDTGVPATQGSGGNNLYVSGTTADTVTTPTIDLSGAVTATVSYLARRTSSYEADSLRVTASTDGGATFPHTLLAAGAALPASPSDYDSMGVEVPVGLLVDGFRLRFEALGGDTGGANARLDDVRVHGEAPVLMLEPAELAFFAAVFETQQKDVTATNHTGASVTVEAPQVSGTVFSVTPSGPVALAPGASQVYAVTFAPLAEGDVQEAMTLAYGERVATVDLSGSTARDELGFSAEAGTALEESDEVPVPLLLQHAAPEGLQGLQFSITWSDPLVEAVGVVRGPDVDDAGTWTLASEPGPGRLDVLLMNTKAEGLPAGRYDALLTLLVDVGELDEREEVDLQVEMEDVVGARAAPGGDDAGLQLGIASYALTVEGRSAQFQLSTTDLDLGATLVGEATEGEVTVANPGGSAPLIVSGVASSNTLFVVSPPTAVVPPNGSQVFAVAFAPTAAQYGVQEGTVTFTHDGVAVGADELSVEGVGTGGQGDADADGLVDAVDLVRVIDFILGRENAAAQQRTSADLFPFPEGDGALDVRDLTVLVQAIVHGTWPDEVPLPVEPAMDAAPQRAAAVAAKRATGAGAVVHLRAKAGAFEVELEHAQPLRALQIELAAVAVTSAPEVVLQNEALEGTVVRVHADERADKVRLLLYRPDGSVMLPGRYPLVVIPTATPIGRVAPGYAVAVDEQRERMEVAVRKATGTGADEEEALPDRVRLGMPFPQPFLVSHTDKLHVPVELPDAAVVHGIVFDVLGRQVVELPETHRPAGKGLLAWDGRDSRGAHAAPGVYVLHVQAGAEVRTRTLVLAR